MSISLSTRSVSPSLARLSGRGGRQEKYLRSVATLETSPIHASLRDEKKKNLIPALKRRAKLVRTLRVEDS